MAAICAGITIEDAKGAIGGFKVCMPIGTPNEAAVQFAQELATRADVVTGGVIRSISMSQDVALPSGLKAAAQTNSDVEEGALFLYNVAGGYRTRTRIPTFLESLVASNSRQVNVGNTDVAALINLMTNGGLYAVSAQSAGNVAVLPSDGRGADIIGLLSALEQFVRSRPGRP